MQLSQGEWNMNQAIVDPEQLRHFAMMLKRFNSQLGDSSSKLKEEMSRLGASWRDQEHRKFSAEFEDHWKQLQRLLETTEGYIPYLIRKAELIEEYQRNG
jgi:uncharacterized protein YukE